MTGASPPFGLTVLREPTETSRLIELSPEVHETLFKTGVASQFAYREYSVDPAPALLNSSQRGQLVKFGTTGLGSAMCVDPSTGEVFEFIDAPSEILLFVNSSLAHFNDLTRAMADRQPYYSADSSDADVATAAADLAELIGAIDPPALLPGTYWSTFVDDAAMGDLSTEDLEAPLNLSGE